MSTAGELLEQAKNLHRVERWPEAEQLYRRVLAMDPSAYDARCLLGALCQEQGRLTEAAEHLSSALRIRPQDADVQFDLGMILAGLGRIDEGISHVQAACTLNSQSGPFAAALAQLRSTSHCERAIELLAQDNLDGAEMHCRQAVLLTPESARAHLNLATVLRAREKWGEAAHEFGRALELDGSLGEARRGLGHVYLSQGRNQDAAEEFRQLLAASPDDADALHGRGLALAQASAFAEAAADFRRLTVLQPTNAAALSLLGAMLGVQGQFDQAEAALRRAIELDAKLADAHANLGDVLKDQNRCAAAADCYRRAIAVQPDFADAHLNLALALLLEGRLSEGWPEYEWRWKTLCQAPPHAVAPRWQGAPLPGGTILLSSEQGIGDSIQFLRYAPRVRQRVGRVVVEVAPALARYAAGCPGVDRAVARGEPTGAFDVQASLLSLPGIFGTTRETIPPPTEPPALPDDLLAAWRGVFAGQAGIRVGLCWQGNPAHLRDRDRSVPPHFFAPLARIPGVQLYSLQWGEAGKQLARQPELQGKIVDLGDRLGDMLDMAAIVRNLDLMITCDSAPAHLAGALGVATWVALAFAPDWRWLLGRSDSPWYPAVRLFRQPRRGDWQSVVADMARALRALVEEKKS